MCLTERCGYGYNWPDEDRLREAQAVVPEMVVPLHVLWHFVFQSWKRTHSLIHATPASTRATHRGIAIVFELDSESVKYTESSYQGGAE